MLEKIKKKTIPKEFWDDAMEIISSEVGFQEYFRDNSETGLCESQHSRKLGKMECYVKGGRIEDIDDYGRVMMKDYGYENEWIIV